MTSLQVPKPEAEGELETLLLVAEQEGLRLRWAFKIGVRDYKGREKWLREKWPGSGTILIVLKRTIILLTANKQEMSSLLLKHCYLATSPGE